MTDIRTTSLSRPGRQGDGYLIGPNLAGAIKTLVAQNESAVHKVNVPRLGVVLEADQSRRPSGKNFRIATFTGSWSINASKTVTFKYQTATPNTATAVNLFSTLGSTSTATKNCAIAREGTAWYLIASECGDCV